MKKILFLIIVTISLCIGKIHSQVIDPNNLPLSGTQTGNNEYEAQNIQSTQVINSGKTTYTAGNSVVLKPGFKVELGAKFEIIMDDDRLNNLTMMTWNLNFPEFVIDHSRHAEVINRVKPDVVALQEVIGRGNFNNLKTLTGMEGEKVWLLDWCINGGCYKYGLAILWKPAFGTPTITKKWISIIGLTTYRTVGYIIAEFEDFCFISTHYPNLTSTAIEDRVVVTQKILATSVVQNCINSGKPIYIGGDFNEDYRYNSIPLFVNNGFEVLNKDTETYPTHNKDSDGNYLPADRPCDYIIGYNTYPNHKTIEHSIPEFLFEAGN